MSSFTSNFKSEAAVLLFMAFIAAAGEIGLRLSVRSLSADVEHLRSLPGVARAIHRDRRGTILFLGNSLTRLGVDLEVLNLVLRDRDRRAVRCFKVHPDDTSLLDWYYVLRRFFLDMRSVPEVVVIGFANRQLEDGGPFHAEQIAAYGGLRYAPELFARDLHGLDAKVNYVLASVSVSFSEADRVRLVVFRRLIPGYTSSAQLFNATIREEARTEKEPAKRQPRERLHRFLRLCVEAHITPVFVAMPVLQPYSVDPSVSTLVEAAGGAFLDLRRSPGIKPGWFPDGYHMNGDAAAMYSRALGERLADFLRRRRNVQSGMPGDVARLRQTAARQLK